MNQVFHIFITYLVLALFIPEVKKYIWIIVLFSIIIDIDHVPGYLRVAKLPKAQRGKLTTQQIIDMFRTNLQEPVTFIIIGIILLALYLVGIWHAVLFILGMTLLLHWIVDFLTVHTRPLSPFSKKVVNFFFDTKFQRLVSEIVLTIIITVLFIIFYFY